MGGLPLAVAVARAEVGAGAGAAGRCSRVVLLGARVSTITARVRVRGGGPRRPPTLPLRPPGGFRARAGVGLLLMRTAPLIPCSRCSKPYIDDNMNIYYMTHVILMMP